MTSTMSFLRPLPAPRPAFVQIFLRRLATTSTDTAPASEAIGSSLSVSKTPVSQLTLGNLEPLAYFVHRTPSLQLPIYHLAKRGGNLHQTRIRKIDGSLEALRNDLQRELRLEDKQIAINTLTKQVIIKGWRKKEVAAFLSRQSF